MLERLFKLKENETDIRTEILAGITTFLTMAYILAVNPMILENTGMPFAGVLTATILVAALSSILMGLVANLPFALAPGMGINAFFTFSMVIGMKMPWQTALGAVFISGIIFMLMTVSNCAKPLCALFRIVFDSALPPVSGCFSVCWRSSRPVLSLPTRPHLSVLADSTRRS